jgi:hypothetical protein
MATTRNKRQRASNKPVLSDNMLRFFERGQDSIEAMSLSEKRLRQRWQLYQAKHLSDFIKNNPCQRPWAWWEYSAPRWHDPYPGTYFHGTLPEPRQRLGGVGTPDYEFLNYVPSFRFGLPTGFLSPWLVDYYNGRAKDVNGKLIPSKHKPGDFTGQAISLEDPPVYESECAYLERHGLLTQSERRYLQQHQKLMEPITITAEV